MNPLQRAASAWRDRRAARGPYAPKRSLLSTQPPRQSDYVVPGPYREPAAKPAAKPQEFGWHKLHAANSGIKESSILKRYSPVLDRLRDTQDLHEKHMGITGRLNAAEVMHAVGDHAGALAHLTRVADLASERKQHSGLAVNEHFDTIQNAPSKYRSMFMGNNE